MKPAAKWLIVSGAFLSLGLALLFALETFAYIVIWSLVRRGPLGVGSLLSAVCQDICNVWPGIGFYVLITGFGLAVLGLLGKLFSSFEDIPAFRTSQAMAANPMPLPGETSGVAVSSPRLEFQTGELANQAIPVNGVDFSIGRGRDNDLWKTYQSSAFELG